MKTRTYLLTAAFLFCFYVLKAQQDKAIHPAVVSTGTFLGITPPLRDLPALTPAEIELMKEKALKKAANKKIEPRLYPFAETALPKGPDEAWQKTMGKSSGSRAPLVNFEGQTTSSYPPDCNGTAGPNHFMQTVNVTYAIYNKTGTLLAGPTALNTLFSGVPGATQNDGDPIVLYDEQADRWLVAEFTFNLSNDYMLVAVSTTNDPTGSWYKYSFDVTNDPDYPKFGVWQDGYYMGINSTSGNDIYVFERSKMLQGLTAQMVGFDNSWRPGTGFLCVPPLDNDGTAAPTGAPGMFIAFNDDAVSGGSDQLWLYELAVNWTTPTASTFNRTQQLNVTTFDSQFTSTWDDISQPTSQKLDGVPQVIMNAPQYRNFGTYQTIVCCHTVDVDATNHAGIRWYELRKTAPATTWTIRQQGTYAPDANSRWMGSIMLNGSGKIALGYSISSSTVYPGIRYCGQSASAYAGATGVMDIAEQVILSGTVAQISYNRWGDYALMSVDPADDQTFWFSSEYVKSGGSTKGTKIASFKFDNSPTATTLAATSVTGTSATLNGTVNPSGLSTNYYFQWGTTTSYGNNTTTTSAGSGTANVAVSANITGLTAGITYHFRLVATNSDGPANGNDLSFTPGMATVTTTAASSITAYTAISGGNVTSDGGLSVTARGVCWSTSANPTISGSHTTDGSSTGVFTSSLTGLSASTTYHIRAYATNSSNTYYGNDLTFTTSCGAITSFPWNEGFENGGVIPNCWTQEQVNNSGINFTFVTGNGASNPSAAHTGTYNACLKDNTTTDNKTKLITPPINLSSLGSPVLTFWHTQAVSSSRQDQLTVFYKTSAGGTWTQLAIYTSSITAWTMRTISLPGASSDYYIAFEGNAKRGYGVCIDDVSITGTVVPSLTVSPSDRPVTAAPGTTSFTVTTSSAWTATSNQGWCTVTPSGTGSGTITANFTKNTTASSRVANITVTVTGVTPVVVTVTQAAPTLSVTPSDQPVTAASGTTPFTVTSNSEWTAASNQGWCTVTPSGTGSGTITATYTANTLLTSRIANITVTVSGLTPVIVTVTQAALVPALSVTPTDRPVDPAAGNTTFTVTSNTDWTASSNQSWCTVTPSGSGSGTITATYSVNNTASARVANVTVTVSGLSPVVVTVTQAAPTLAVTPANQSVSYTAGNTSFSVTSNTNWDASSDQTWCTVTASGSGSGTITATYIANPTYSSRIAYVTVNVTGLSPVVVSVTQAAAPAPEFNFTIANDVQTSDRTLEFDLYLLNMIPSTPFELSIIQSGILVNNEIVNGGTITPSLIPGTSELMTAQQPTAIAWVLGSPSGCIKIGAKAAPGCGSGTVISTTGLGTRIYRIRITNSVPFTAGSQANLDFCFSGTPFLPTRVYRYSGTPCTSNLLTTNSSNCFSLGDNPVLNGPPSLSVTPSNRPVTSPAGTTAFEVTSNTDWTATSNQTWCTVTPSGFGEGAITANYDENTTPSPRVANVTVTVSGLSPVVVTVTQAGTSVKTLNLSSVFIEGLYNGNSTMFPAQDEFGPHWPDGSADHIKVELHNSATYGTIEYTASDVVLSTSGTATMTIPVEKNGSYYVTVKHRNSIETTSAAPVNFSGATITYAFDAKAKAYGDNMTNMLESDGITLSPPLIFGGDENQDGMVEAEDLNDIGNMADAFASGYLKEDIYGDGMIEAADLNIAGNNADYFAASITP